MLSAIGGPSTRDGGVVLNQLRIEIKEKPTLRGNVKKEKMAVGSRRRKKARSKRTKSTDNSRAVEQRKERSRDAARSRRGKENAQFDELAKLLPLPSAITSQLDKASIVRLTISYLNMKQFNIHKQSKGYGNRSSDSFLSESSTSPPSDADVDILFGSPGIPSPGSSSPSPAVIPGNSAGAVVPYNPSEISLQDLSDNSGIFLLQALDGFVFVLSNEGKVLYVSETVSNHLGLSQVELTGSNISSYIHPEDQDDLFGLLEIARQEAENSNGQAATGAFTDNIRFFGQQPFDNNDDLPSEEKPKSFFMRMKCTLVRRGGSYTKSSGFKVIHCMGRMKRYEAKGLPEVKFAFVAIGQPLPTMNINELPLECNMFVSRVNMDLKIVYCEGRIHKFTDYFARDIVGISAYDFYHANDIGIIQGHHAKFLSKGQVLTKYYRWMNKNGGWVWLQTKASLIPHPSNPELKQMLCLNYIVSEVEHRGVVLGMTQLEDKPQLHSRAYITEVDNDTDETGELKDAQFDDQVMVYPKWHENSDKLVPKPTLMDTLALSRTGYTKVSGLETPSLSDEVFTTMTETLSKAPAVTSWSKRCSSKADDGSTSTLEDDFEDLTEIINSELTKLDREIVNFVANGSSDVSATSQMPDANIENVLSGNWLVSTTSNGSIPSGNVLQTPKMEPISLEDAVNFNEQNSQPMSTPSQTIGNLPVGSYPDDVKPNLIPFNGESMFQLPSFKRQGINSPCMFNSATSTSVRNFQPNGPIQGQMNNTSNLHVVGALQQMPNVRNSNSLGAPVVPVRNAPYASNQPVNMSELGPVQGSSIASTPVPLNPQMASPKEPQLQLAQLLKDALPDNAAFTDQMVVDLVDEMMVDQEGETQRRKDDQKLASLLQQGGFVQPEVIIKQEVVTPTMSQPTFGFPTVSNTVAPLQCQLSMPPNAFTSTNNVNGGEAMFVGSPQGPQNGTVTNQDSLNSFQNGNVQFSSQEDTNMNFLNSLSNNLPGLPGNNASWNSNILPKQSTASSGLFSQSNAPNFNMVPQNGSRVSQGNSFNINTVRNMSQLDSLLQSAHVPSSNYQSINGAGLFFNNPTFANMTRKL
ncbi:uncharacterized protein [Montipora foliosa]|uniref:uncharacterized protein isoform X2 n=1 Tax=Montipora foliosa TaxID=591990 RepID=UPI0035F184CE